MQTKSKIEIFSSSQIWGKPKFWEYHLIVAAAAAKQR
jgi:hypothetical protein